MNNPNYITHGKIIEGLPFPVFCSAVQDIFPLRGAMGALPFSILSELHDYGTSTFRFAGSIYAINIALLPTPEGFELHLSLMGEVQRMQRKIKI